MTNEPSPRPWHIAHPGEIEDANGDILYNLRYCIGGGVDEANAALIVAAVNERDRLRDLVRRLAALVVRYADDDGAYSDAYDEIAEARAALGEDKE